MQCSSKATICSCPKVHGYVEHHMFSIISSKYGPMHSLEKKEDENGQCECAPDCNTDARRRTSCAMNSTSAGCCSAMRLSCVSASSLEIAQPGVGHTSAPPSGLTATIWCVCMTKPECSTLLQRAESKCSCHWLLMAGAHR